MKPTLLQRSVETLFATALTCAVLPALADEARDRWHGDPEIERVHDRHGQGTLDGGETLVIAHRGASGYFPEETLEAYRLAIAMGADVIEPDLVVSKDGVLIARHDITLSQSTNVASHPEFASRRRAGEKGDGEPVAADWFVADFTLAELRTLGATSPNHPAARVYDGLFRIVTFQEVLDLIQLKKKETGRVVAVYPETKNPSYHLALWRTGRIRARLENLLVEAINANGLDRHDAPIRAWSPMPIAWASSCTNTRSAARRAPTTCRSTRAATRCANT